jgi:NADH:ubiquinone reductase (H+-translocating)
MPEKKRIVVIGAGMAGLYVAQKLRKRSDSTVTLISEQDHFLFLPRLTELFSSSIPEQKAYLPLNQLWKGELIIDKANLVNPQEKTIMLNSGKTTTYDLLVIAVGSQVNFFGTPGSQYSYSFYNKADADKLKEHIVRMVEADEQPGTHTFAVVGGGPTGVEVAHVVQALVRKQRPASKVVVIEAGPAILRVLPPKLSEAAKAVLEKEAVEIMTETAVKNITPMSVDIQKKDGTKETIPCYTTIWAAGSKPQQIAINGIELSPKGDIPVQPSLRTQTDPNIFAVGDCAATAAPKTAQTAVQHAKVAAENINRLLDGKPLVPFEYQEKGTLIALESETVGIVFGKLLKGFIARQMRDKYYQFQLGSYK